MKKQRHNWFSYLVIFSLLLLPLKYGQAMGHEMSMKQNFECHYSNVTTQQHHQDHQAKQLMAKGKVCDTEHNCGDQHQCSKLQFDQYAKNKISIKLVTSSIPSFLSTRFSEFYPKKELRPPKA